MRGHIRGGAQCGTHEGKRDTKTNSSSGQKPMQGSCNAPCIEGIHSLAEEGYTCHPHELAATNRSEALADARRLLGADGRPWMLLKQLRPQEQLQRLLYLLPGRW